MGQAIYVLSTMDTKGHELAYLAERIQAAGAASVLVDVGTGAIPQVLADIPREAVAAHHPESPHAVLACTDRGQAVTAMSVALERFLVREHAAGKVGAVLGVGGTGGTALISPAMRALPVGLPKLLVSTVASGNTAPYVGASDLTLMNSVVDVAGLNRVSRQVLGNAAHAVVGMARHTPPTAGDKPAGLTMFGVTTSCVTAVRETLEAAGWDCLVLHATGTGGQAMEKLAASGLVAALLDLTTTEVADEVVGGVFRAGASRFDVLAERDDLPCVLSLGALDMVNFGARDTVPAEFSERKFHVHNANVTLMRTTPEENRAFARWMVPKLNRAKRQSRPAHPRTRRLHARRAGHAFPRSRSRRRTLRGAGKDDSVSEVQAIADACHALRDDVIILCHGGPIAMPDDAAYVLQRTKNVHGFHGASSMERLPTEIAITEQIRRFGAVTFDT